jgi:hypothetical protein
MHRMRRHSTRATGALALWLLSASVLLALVWGGAVAHATDSSGVQYSDAPPTVTGDNPPNAPAGGTSPARSSKADGGATAPRAGSTDPRSSGGKSSADDQSSSQGDKPTSDDDGGNGQSSPDAGSNGKREQSQDDGQLLGVPSSSDGDDGGSSPLLPILIAVLVLAAISAGAVLLKARRQDGEPGEHAAPRPS